MAKKAKRGVKSQAIRDFLKANKKAKLKLQKVENINICLKYIKAKNINLVNIGAEGTGPSRY